MGKRSSQTVQDMLTPCMIYFGPLRVKREHAVHSSVRVPFPFLSFLSSLYQTLFSYIFAFQGTESVL